MRFYLRKLRINSQGYTPEGFYFGTGLPVYEFESDGACDYVRAYDRDDAKDAIRRTYPGATFYN
jgi:hypothetical protein